RFFDQIRFYPVSESELLKLRKDFIRGQFQLRVEETTFSLQQHHLFLQQNQAAIHDFKTRQQAAFEAERERWRINGQIEFASESDLDEADAQSELDLPEGSHAIASPVTGTVWKTLAQEGQQVKTGDILVVIEAMKMEIAVDTPISGTIARIVCRQGEAVSAGQLLAVLKKTAP
ncbi:MAG: biotin/lipoyl-binding protein, partial [Nitrosomonadaceae bacterium]|nr:biotin/lipoyl-binding protein [Nitrosomonadaceae bacterium]